MLVHGGSGLGVGGGWDDGPGDARSRLMSGFASVTDGCSRWVGPVIKESLTVDCSPLVLLVERVRNERVFSLLVVRTVRAGPCLLGLQLSESNRVACLLATAYAWYNLVTLTRAREE